MNFDFFLFFVFSTAIKSNAEQQTADNKQMEQRMETMMQANAQQQAKLNRWCEEYDEDGNGEFDRKELASLLNALFPGHTCGEDMLDELMERATGVYAALVEIAAAFGIGSATAMGQGAPPPPGQQPQPLRSHPPALQRPPRD